MSESPVWNITSFYRFVPLTDDRVDALREEIESWMAAHSLLGLVLVAPEGVNGTLAGLDADVVSAFKSFLTSAVGVTDVRFKDSTSARRPFRRLTVDRREEIVGLKRPDVVPSSTEDHHLSPSEWQAWLESDKPHVLIDTRNRYETLAGKFKGAIDPNLKAFSEWGEYLDQAELPKDVPVLMYCTGGIRCEKAILEMRSRGFEEVYQLRDGILGYLAEYPDGEFEGECYVFDDRVTVGPNLEPTGNFGVCPGCGLTAHAKKPCGACGKEFFECDECSGNRLPACTKRCRDLIEQRTRGK